MIVFGDDGKERRQSCTAQLKIMHTFSSNGASECSFTGYGYNQSEALSSLVIQLTKTIRTIDQIALDHAVKLDIDNPFGLNQSELDAY